MRSQTRSCNSKKKRNGNRAARGGGRQQRQPPSTEVGKITNAPLVTLVLLALHLSGNAGVSALKGFGFPSKLCARRASGHRGNAGRAESLSPAEAAV
eukprot:6710183-Pyramimonas_sp.AAC.1